MLATVLMPTLKLELELVPKPKPISAVADTSTSASELHASTIAAAELASTAMLASGLEDDSLDYSLPHSSVLVHSFAFLEDAAAKSCLGVAFHSSMHS